MTLIFLRPTAPKAKKFIKKTLRGNEPRSIYDIKEGDCCLAPAIEGKRDYMVTFLNDVPPEMEDYIYDSNTWAALRWN